MRLSVAAIAICLAIVGVSAAQNATAAMRKPTNIPAQPLGSALEALAKERDLQVIYRSDLVGNVQSAGAVGVFTPEQALGRLLAGTGLTYRYLNDTTVTIAPASTGSPAASPAGSSSPAPPSSPADNGNQKGGGSFWDRFLVAQAAAGQTARAAAVDRKSEQASEKKPVQLEEVLVTAQKREERLIDTPQSASVLSSNDIAKLGVLQFRDYANTIPGLSFATAGAGNTQITMRGVSVGFDVGPTTAIYVDEVPYGPSTVFSLGAQFALDAALFDLDRIEVLRGPQGTLYGASAMGGLIKYVTKRPDMSTVGGDAHAGLSGTQDGGVGYNVAAAVNMPIVTDKVALRASGFESHDGGYIDNVALGQKDVNHSDVYGGRLDLLFTATDKLSIRITGFLQDINRAGEGTADYTSAGAEPYGSLGQFRRVPESFDQRFRVIGGTATYDLGLAALTSISSYQEVRTNQTLDISAIYVPLLNSFGFGPYSAVSLPLELATTKFAQEIRLASEGIHPVEWLVGGYYTHENSKDNETFVLRDTAGQPAPNSLLTYMNPSSFAEYAAFGDLTWHPTDKFDVTGGLRYASDRVESAQTGSGLLVVPQLKTRVNDSVSTYLADSRYHFSDDVMGYLRYATGYRPGGPNATVIDPATGKLLGPSSFKSDSLKSYEAGLKALIDDRRFGIDLAAYYIDWSNIQLGVIRNGFQFLINAPGGATVRGAELTLTARPADALTLASAVAYQDPTLSEGNSDLGGAKGERLPNTPHFTAALNADCALPIGSLQPTIGATLRYVGDRTASFEHSTGYPQYHSPAYRTIDLRAGLTFGAVNTQLYVHNLFDERGQQSVIFPQFGTRVAVLQPRTIGINASVHF